MTNTTLTGTAAKQLQSNFGVGFTLQNMGPGNVYLDNYTSVSPGSSWTLIPGMSIPVADSTQLYACTDAGQTAVVQTLLGVQAQAATVVDVSGTVTVGEVTLAPGSEVGISGPVTANISGGTVDIGAGTIDATITNATVNVGGTVSNRAGNYATLLASKITTVNNTVPGTTVITPPIAGVDITPYRSLIISINLGANGDSITNYIDGIFQQLDTNGLAVGAGQHAQWGIYQVGTPTGVAALLTIPVIGDTLSATIKAVIGTGVGPTAAFASVNIYGSHQAVNGPQYSNSGQGSPNCLLGKPSGVVAEASGTVTQVFESTNDPGYLQMLGSATASAGVATIQQINNGVASPIAKVFLQGVAAELTDTTPFVPPMRPLQLVTVQNTASLTTMVNQ